MPAVESIVFDIGETLLDDTREFGARADWIGVQIDPGSPVAVNRTTGRRISSRNSARFSVTFRSRH